MIPLPSLQIVKHFIWVGFFWSDNLGVTEYRIREGQSDRPFLGRQRPYRAEGIDLAHSLSFIMAVASSSGWVRAILILLLLVACLISSDTSPLPSSLHTEFWRITAIFSSVEVTFDSSSLLFSGPLKRQALCLFYLFCNLWAFLFEHMLSLGLKMNQFVIHIIYITLLLCSASQPEYFLSIWENNNQKNPNKQKIVQEELISYEKVDIIFPNNVISSCLE